MTSTPTNALFPQADSVCLMDVELASFEVAFFLSAPAAAAVRVCERPSGSGYLYRVDGLTFDAAYPLYWTLSGDALAWTSSADVDRSLRQILGGTRPRC